MTWELIKWTMSGQTTQQLSPQFNCEPPYGAGCVPSTLCNQQPATGFGMGELVEAALVGAATEVLLEEIVDEAFD